jgi:hypothetical protein
VSSPSIFDPVPLLSALAEASVDFVVIGGVAGGAHGSAYPTYDLDIACGRDPANLERLAGVLTDLGATLRGALTDLPFLLDADTLERGGNFTFRTSSGPLDLFAYPEGAAPYERIRADAKTIDVAGHAILIASLDHLIAMKEAAGRPKDKLMSLEYRVLSDEQRSQS